MISILLVDNHDSFTYNLVELLRQTGLCRVKVVLLEEASFMDISAYQGIILSPGPGLPEEKNGLRFFIEKVIATEISLLGVCLGHQAVAEYFGAHLMQLQRIVHGEASEVEVSDDSLFYANIDKPLQVGRYHSWVVNDLNWPEALQVTAKTTDGLIMGFKHKTLKIRGVQYHPESILTPQGLTLLKNWLRFCL